MVVAYDHVRGEPRDKFYKKKSDSSGHCIDCNQCAHVCPTGIDIRNGTQLNVFIVQHVWTHVILL